MTKLTASLPAFLVLAAATTLAAAQDTASKTPALHQSGCVDFSAEYEGCLSFGVPPDVPASVGPDRAFRHQVDVVSEPIPSTSEARIATSGISNTRRQTDAVPVPIPSLGGAGEVEGAIGHLGVP